MNYLTNYACVCVWLPSRYIGTALPTEAAAAPPTDRWEPDPAWTDALSTRRAHGDRARATVRRAGSAGLTLLTAAFLTLLGNI